MWPVESWAKIPLGDVVERGVDALEVALRAEFRVLSLFLDSSIDGLEGLLTVIPPLIFIAVLGVLAWRVRGWKVALFVVVSLLLILNLGLWSLTIKTLAIVLTATIVSTLIGIPVGILKAHSKVIHTITRPILDFMQTIPIFVYLIPALMFFGLGTVPGVIATIVFALPPPVRLTYLGIRQVPVELIEAGKAFGSNRWQMLYKVEIPNAIPSIVMGINQCIMMSLSMVVIAAMIGAGGLGKEVMRAMATINIGMGFEAGLGVVILAIILDRLIRTE